MRNILAICFFATYGAASLADGSCLEREWKNLSSYEVLSEAQKKFDQDNDFNKLGASYSCYVYSTPTEINDFLSKLKNSVNANNINELSDLLYFPLPITNSSSVADKKYFTIKNKDELIENYDKIFTSDFKKLINCLNLKTMGINPPNGMEAGYGGIWINRFSGSRQLFVTSVSVFQDPIIKWVKNNCESNN